jgi:hypothetical protein
LASSNGVFLHLDLTCRVEHPGRVGIDHDHRRGRQRKVPGEAEDFEGADIARIRVRIERRPVNARPAVSMV